MLMKYKVTEVHKRTRELCQCRGDRTYELGSLQKHEATETVTFSCFNCQRKVVLTRHFLEVP